MSMKTSSKYKSKSVVFIVSLLLHALALWFITSGGGVSGLFKDTWFESKPPVMASEPMVVEVVEMPTAPKDNEVRPEKPTAYSERDHSTERETYPEKGRRRLPTSASSPASVNKKTVAIRETPVKVNEPLKKAATEDETFTPNALPEFNPSVTPRLFPSKERLSTLAERYERETPQSERGKVLNINTSELKYQKYVMNMKRRIEFYWQYPSSAVRSSEQGRLKVNFKITKDGAVRDVDVVRSSNYPALDDAAVMAIKLASPFNPLPGDFGIDEGIVIRANFEYELLYTNR